MASEKSVSCVFHPISHWADVVCSAAIIDILSCIVGGWLGFLVFIGDLAVSFIRSVAARLRSADSRRNWQRNRTLQLPLEHPIKKSLMKKKEPVEIGNLVEYNVLGRKVKRTR